MLFNAADEEASGGAVDLGSAAQKMSWKGHASLPALARKDRVVIVFRRMPAADFHRFADEYPHWLAQ